VKSLSESGRLLERTSHSIHQDFETVRKQRTV
jgi:hypothetical protein